MAAVAAPLSLGLEGTVSVHSALRYESGSIDMQQVRNRCKGDGPAKWKSNLRDPVISSGQLSGWECVGHDRLRSGVRPGRCGAHPFAIRRTHLPMLFPSRAGAPRNLAKSHRGLVIHEVDPLITRTRLSPSWASEPEPHRAASRQGVELHLGPRLFYMDEGQRHPAVGDFKRSLTLPGAPASSLSSIQLITCHCLAFPLY